MRSELSEAYRELRSALVTAREDAGLSQREVADAIGVLQQFVSKIEQGERRIDVVELVLLTEVLPLDVPALVAKIAATIRSSAGVRGKGPHRRRG